MSKSKSKSKIVPRKDKAIAAKMKKARKESKEKSKDSGGTSKGLLIFGIIIFIIGIILVYTVGIITPNVPYGELWLPSVVTAVIFLGIFVMYKGFTKDLGIDSKQTIKCFIIFGIFFMPILFSLIQFDPLLNQKYSVTNTTGTGCSDFKNILESDGYTTNTLLSSYNELQRLSDYHPINRTLLIILGPKQLFGIFEVFSLIDFINNGGKVFIACDIGTANQIAIAQTMLGIFDLGTSFSFIQLEDSYVCDETDGYNFDVPTSVGMIKVYSASCIQSTFGGGVAYLNAETPGDIWLDKNNNGEFDSDEEKKPYILAYDGGSFVYYSDVELFTNQHINAPGYSHESFARKIVDDLTGGDTNYLILFDQKHQVKNGLHPSFIFGLLLGNMNFFQFHWALVPLGIILIYKIANKYIPNYSKKKKKEIKKKMKIKYKAKKREKTGSTYVAKLNWYKRLGRYRDATNLLYKRLKRNLMKKLKMNSWDLDTVIDKIIEHHFEEEIFDENRLIKAFDKLEKLANKEKNISSEEEFLNVFLEMKWISFQI
ncbi:MAG: DUF4350 domain-containing protein [Promethearchaeota archaeon]|nr:MAG: DUF4350 domain-containing protein [Candidatus Lokiarchaeota archaeon]